jgi:hypothetical protein
VLVSNDENGGFEKLEVVKRYFHRIFTVISKEVREKLMELDLSKDELKEIKRELAFLSEEQQLEFLEELATEKN